MKSFFHSPRVRAGLGKFLLYAATCGLALLAWRANHSDGSVQHHGPETNMGTTSPDHTTDTMEVLPEPVRRAMAGTVHDHASSPEWKGAESLPVDEQQSLWRAFSEARHEIRQLTEHQKTMRENEHAIYLASNHGQNLRARFLEDGLRLLPGNSHEGWSGVIGLDSPDSRAKLVQEGAAIQYRHASGVTEWFDNRPDGIEHGFIVHGHSPLVEASTLKIPVRLAGLRAESVEGSGDLALVNSEGRKVLTYEHLQVWDATGRSLPAEMKPTSGGLEIAINTMDAEFPVVVDPLILSHQARLGPEPTGSGALEDLFGFSLSVSGERALIGSPKDDDNGLNSGSAYIFARNGTTWELEQKLGAPDGMGYDQFGDAVALSAETALIGATQSDYLGNGKAYAFVYDGSRWVWQATLLASDGIGGAKFGAALSLSGQTALIGAYNSRDAGGNFGRGGAYVFVRDGSNWTQQQKLLAADGTLGDNFGFSVGLSGNTALIGAWGKDTGSNLDHGTAYVFQRTGSTWNFQQKLVAPDTISQDYFGWSVALSGDTALVGAFGDDDLGRESGGAYVFTRNGTTWDLQQKLVPADGAAEDNFGKTVALEGDTALIASTGDDRFLSSKTGSAYVFTRSGSTWSLQQKFTPPADMKNGILGNPLSISGETILIGASENLGNHAGSGLVYVRNGSVWTLQQRLAAGDGATFDSFGISVSLSGDYALVGTYGDDDNGSDSGSAYVFIRSGNVWSQQQKLIASDGAASDFFGWSVAISGDKAIVGAYGDDDIAYMTGSAYAFIRNGTAWTQAQKIKPADLSGYDYFGKTVSLSGDTALIGSPEHRAAGVTSGAAYIYQWSANSWSQQKKLLASDRRPYDNFGVAVCLDGDTALVGAEKDDNKGTESGSAYVFVRNGSTWNQQKILNALDGAAQDFFGSAVSISGDTALIGAPGDDDQAFANGSAYVFARTGSTWSQQQKLMATNTSEYHSFGCAVGVSRGSALVGASKSMNGFYESGSGFAYLFWRIGPVWQLQQILQAPNGEPMDSFGVSACISDRTALIGATSEDGLDSLGGLARDQGSVHVFHNTNPDIDGDGVLDAFETGTGVYVSSSDTGTNPFSADSDSDGLGDAEEINIRGTNPNKADSDGDNYLDATEIAEVGNPLDATHRPGMNPRITPAKQITFFSREGVNYFVEGSETGNSGTWAPRLGPILGTGQAVSVVVTFPPPHLRVVESP